LAPDPNSTIALLIPTSVLIASLIGSLHCVGMCGPFIGHIAQTPKELAFYHGCRLLSYALLGLCAGWLGKLVLQSQLHVITMGSTILLSSYFFLMAISLFLNKPIHRSPKLLSTFFSKLLNISSSRTVTASIIGSASVLLPCGWLYVFIFGSIATVSPIRGLILMFFFWLGTLPALTASQWIIQRFITPLQKQSPKLSACILMCAGVLTLLQRFH